MNTLDVININNIIAYRERKRPDLVNGGEIPRSELIDYPTSTLKRLLEEYNSIVTKEIKSLTDDIFNKYANPGDNIIIISGAYVPERRAYEIEEPIRSINFNNHDYNKLYYPIAGSWDLNTYYPEHEGADEAKYDSFYAEVDGLRELIYSLNIPTPEEFWEYDNEALNEYWYGCIGIMRDYKVVSFVIRDDGLLCDEDSLESFHNSIIKSL